MRYGSSSISSKTRILSFKSYSQGVPIKEVTKHKVPPTSFPLARPLLMVQLCCRRFGNDIGLRNIIPSFGHESRAIIFHSSFSLYPEDLLSSLPKTALALGPRKVINPVS